MGYLPDDVKSKSESSDEHVKIISVPPTGDQEVELRKYALTKALEVIVGNPSTENILKRTKAYEDYLKTGEIEEEKS